MTEKKPIRVSRKHYEDLEAAAIGVANTNSQLAARFEQMKQDPGFEIVDNTKPGEILNDLSIMFMYPNQIPDLRCKTCRDQVKTWRGDDAKCGFHHGLFIGSENWQCGTIAKIRAIADRLGMREINGVNFHATDGEDRYATIDVSNMPSRIFGNEESGEDPLCLWICWYKNRGSTSAMYLMFENIPPRPPTEAECLAIIEAYKAEIDE